MSNALLILQPLTTSWFGIWVLGLAAIGLFVVSWPVVGALCVAFTPLFNFLSEVDRNSIRKIEANGGEVTCPYSGHPMFSITDCMRRKRYRLAFGEMAHYAGRGWITAWNCLGFLVEVLIFILYARLSVYKPAARQRPS